MKKVGILTTVAAGVFATVAMYASASYAKDDPVAQNTATVWVGGKGETSFADKLNKMHAEMEAKGFKVTDVEIYTENGDMRGAFVTYVR
jgi:maltose-binding protein MalE